MAVLTLPVVPDVPHQEFQVTLEGQPYLLEVRWNVRAEVWVLTMKTAEGEVLRAGTRLCLGVPLLPPRRGAGSPPGELLLVDNLGEGEPTLESLGAGVELVYLESVEVAAALAEVAG